MAFNLESFKVLDIPELIINIWCSGEHIKKCTGDCRIEIYLEFCVESLKTRWMSEWGSFDEIKNKLLANDKTFINDLNNFSTLDKQYLTDFVNEI